MLCNYSPMAPIPPDRKDLFHGRDKNIDDILAAFEGGRLRRLYFVNGIRRVGKTTLLGQLSARITTQSVLPILLNFEQVIDAFGEFEQLPTVRFIRGLMRTCVTQAKIGTGDQQLALEPTRTEAFEDDPPWYVFDGWLDELRRLSGRQCLLLCIDEMQSVVRLIARRVLDDGVLTWIRSKIQAESDLLIVCTGSEPYSKMRSRYDASNLWGNIKPYPISFLARRDMEKVATVPVVGDGVRWHDLSLAALWDMTEGHPWIIQNICDRILRSLNSERRRIVSPRDIVRATDNLIIDDPTSVKLWWNEGQELVTDDMVSLAFTVLTLQKRSRLGVLETELIKSCSDQGMRNVGATILDMVDLELLTKDRSKNIITIRSRFLEEFLVDLRRQRMEEQAEQVAVRQPFVAVMFDWENIKHRLMAEAASSQAMMAACEGAVLGKILMDRARRFGQPHPKARYVVANFLHESKAYLEDRNALDRLNYQTILSSVSGNAKADRSDHKLREKIRDVLELEGRKDIEPIETYIIGAGDADFNESIQTLLNRQKRVVLWCTRSGMARYYEDLAKHRLLTIEYLEDLVFKNEKGRVTAPLP